MPSRFRFALSQLGAKPNGTEALQLLVSAADLPGTGWNLADERTWRTGRQNPQEPWARRAAAEGSVTAWRSFQAGDRWIWAQLVPTANSADSESALRSAPHALMKNLRAKVTVDSESEVPGISVDGTRATWAYEQRTSGHPAAGTTRLLACTIDACLIVIAGSGRPDWTWDEIAGVVERQRHRLGALA